MIDFDNTIVLCLGLGNFKPEDMVNQCITYDTKKVGLMDYLRIIY